MGEKIVVKNVVKQLLTFGADVVEYSGRDLRRGRGCRPAGAIRTSGRPADAGLFTSPRESSGCPMSG